MDESKDRIHLTIDALSVLASEQKPSSLMIFRGLSVLTYKSNQTDHQISSLSLSVFNVEAMSMTSSTLVGQLFLPGSPQRMTGYYLAAYRHRQGNSCCPRS